MKCEICGKDILKDSQCINYKYYHNDCIINLIKENKELKERIDKAIEYIEDNGISYIDLSGTRCFCNKQSANNLLKILKGE